MIFSYHFLPISMFEEPENLGIMFLSVNRETSKIQLR